MDFDLDRVLRTLLQRQMEYVREDLEDYASAMVVMFKADGTSEYDLPSFEDDQQKNAYYANYVAVAKRRGAVLIVTVNSARSSFGGPWKSVEDVPVLDETNSRPCILLTASGPGMKPVVLEQRYDIVGAEARFDLEPEYMDGSILNLLPGWSDDVRPAPKRKV